MGLRELETDASAVQACLVVFDGTSYSPGLVEELEREVIGVERTDPESIASDGGASRSVAIAWLPADYPESGLADIVRWRARCAEPAALIGCAPNGSAADSVRALAAGFDDFIAGRASGRELAGRARALAKRLQLATTRVQERVSYGRTFIVDRLQHQMWVSGQRVPVTRTELAVMSSLVAARGQTRSRAEILDEAWGDQDLDVGERAVDNVVLRLRRKIGDPDPIVTVRGVGFRLAEQ